MTALYALLPLLAGFLLDALIGDPQGMPHPVRAVGTLITRTEDFVRRHFSSHLTAGGVFLVIVVLLFSVGIPSAVLFVCYHIHRWIGIIVESVLVFTLLAARSLTDETMKVYRALEANDIEGARTAVSMVVGRDTSVLDRAGITRAAVETVAENTSDGVTAPMLYIALFGAAGGLFYKAVNTMDSMVGYRNEHYRQIGCCAARLDDVLNFIPSRLTALFMIAAAYLLRLDGDGARRIWQRDRRKHASPNSAQTEAACAGALGIRLAGNAVYFGELHHKPYIGDDTRPVEPADIVRANWLMRVTVVLFWIVCLILRGVLMG